MRSSLLLVVLNLVPSASVPKGPLERILVALPFLLHNQLRLHLMHATVMQQFSLKK
jgi:hypothetical protein